MLHTCSRPKSTASWPVNRRSIGAGQRGSWGVVLCRRAPSCCLQFSFWLWAMLKPSIVVFYTDIILQHWLTKLAKIWKIHFKWCFRFIFHLIPVLSVWQHRGWSRYNEATIVTQHFNAMDHKHQTGNIWSQSIFSFTSYASVATKFFLIIRLASSSTAQQWYIFYSLYMKVKQCHKSHVYPLFLLCAVRLKAPAQTPGVDYHLIGIACVEVCKSPEATRLSAHLLRTVLPAVICVSLLCKYFISLSFISLSMLCHSSYKNIRRTAVPRHAQTHIQTDLTHVLMGNPLCCGQTYRGKNIKNKQQTNVLEDLMSQWSEN